MRSVRTVGLRVSLRPNALAMSPALSPARSVSAAYVFRGRHRLGDVVGFAVAAPTHASLDRPVLVALARTHRRPQVAQGLQALGNRLLECERTHAPAEDAVLALRLFRQADLGMQLRSALGHVAIVRPRHQVRVLGEQRAQLAAGVVHEEAADQIVLVAQAFGNQRVGRQQHPRVLDAAARQHVMGRAHHAAASVECADARVAHRLGRGRRLQFEQVGMQQAR